jgi:hypothetical protein
VLLHLLFAPLLWLLLRVPNLTLGASLALYVPASLPLGPPVTWQPLRTPHFRNVYALMDICVFGSQNIRTRWRGAWLSDFAPDPKALRSNFSRNGNLGCHLCFSASVRFARDGCGAASRRGSH